MSNFEHIPLNSLQHSLFAFHTLLLKTDAPPQTQSPRSTNNATVRDSKNANDQRHYHEHDAEHDDASN